jgi:hypothetical protein
MLVAPLVVKVDDTDEKAWPPGMANALGTGLLMIKNRVIKQTVVLWRPGRQRITQLFIFTNGI